jgi:hypothetical protein
MMAALGARGNWRRGLAGPGGGDIEAVVARVREALL